MKDKTNVLNTYTDYAWKAACLIGGRVCNPRQQNVVNIFTQVSNLERAGWIRNLS